ncbi:MAG: choice-of-anchor tandem repeat GloVer-containing protein [Candidatus Sulfotelmatobacter sp.]
MRIRFLRLIVSAIALVVLTAMAPVASGQNYRLLYTFAGGTDGSSPNGNLVFDSAGNLYGTTNAGGNSVCGNLAQGCGVVFKLSPNADGAWTKTTLHTFIGNNGIRGYDGSFPNGGLVFDQAGNLYGTTSDGGYYGYGSVFELSPSRQGWKETILLSFNYFEYGAYPVAGLLIDKLGNLYGTAGGGGKEYGACGGGCGTVFELSPSSTGGWTPKILYRFLGAPRDGSQPYGLATDSSGNLYGMTLFGGPGFCPSGCGVVFEVSRTSSGGWTERVLHNFGAGDGWNPSTAVTSDGGGGFYGPTELGGTARNGTVFHLVPEQNASWGENILHNFLGANHEDPAPGGNVVLDAAGNLYGTAPGWDSGVTNGDLYELSPNEDGSWSESILYAFTGHADGAVPWGGLTWDVQGNLYGAAGGGGDNLGYFGDGVIFELTP